MESERYVLSKTQVSGVREQAYFSLPSAAPVTLNSCRHLIFPFFSVSMLWPLTEERWKSFTRNHALKDTPRGSSLGGRKPYRVALKLWGGHGLAVAHTTTSQSILLVGKTTRRHGFQSKSFYFVLWNKSSVFKSKSFITLLHFHWRVDGFFHMKYVST